MLNIKIYFQLILFLDPKISKSIFSFLASKLDDNKKSKIVLIFITYLYDNEFMISKLDSFITVYTNGNTCR